VFGAVVGRFTHPKHNRLLDNFSKEAAKLPLNMKEIAGCKKDLSDAGLTSEEILESVAVISAFTAISRIVDATGHKDLSPQVAVGIRLVPILFFLRSYWPIILLGLVYYFW